MILMTTFSWLRFVDLSYGNEKYETDPKFDSSVTNMYLSSPMWLGNGLEGDHNGQSLFTHFFVSISYITCLNLSYLSF